MFRNYLKTAFRNLRKSPFYTSLNVTGLAMGLATCLLILLYVTNELSYDRYNTKVDHIYRINNEIKFGSNYFDLAVAPALLGPEILKEFPEVEQYTRLLWHDPLVIRKGSENFNEGRVASADSTLFDVFSLQMIAGNPKDVLREPNTLVITEKIARKYFNSTDVVGKNLFINNSRNYTVTAVIKDVPAESHFSFDLFVPMLENEDSRTGGWLSENYSTYLLIKPGSDIKKLDAGFNKLLLRHTENDMKAMTNKSMAEFEKEGGYIRSSLTPLTRIHLYSNKTGELQGSGNIEYVYIFSAIAVFILLIACVNFMNLSTARSANRAKEVGIRKVLGSLRKNLITQFLTESFLLSFISLIIAILATALLLPYFNELAGINIRTNDLLNPYILSSCVLLMLLVGLLAGSYPAFFLSAFQPIKVLKGNLVRGFKRSWLRDGLVVFQFTISIILIVGTVVIYNQLGYIRNKDMGYDRSQVLMIGGSDRLKDQAGSFRNELLQISGVKNVTASGYFPVNYNRNNTAFFSSPSLDQKTAISMQIWSVDENYIPTLDIKLSEGRNFSPEFLTDSSAVVINEAAAKFISSKALLGKKIYRIDDLKTKSLQEFHIVGVVKNFHFSSLRAAITPLAFRLSEESSGFAVRINTSDIPGIIKQIKTRWQAMVPGQPFDYSFMDDDFNKQYEVEQKTGQVFISFTILAIVIACLGLFGLVAFAAEQRTKEIGIRKLLGSSVTGIVRLLSTDFLKLVVISIVLATPISWWIMNKWLQDFVYRINISWWMFAGAALAAILIALLTACFQAIKAALANPINSLRNE